MYIDLYAKYTTNFPLFPFSFPPKLILKTLNDHTLNMSIFLVKRAETICGWSVVFHLIRGYAYYIEHVELYPFTQHSKADFYLRFHGAFRPGREVFHGCLVIVFEGNTNCL